MFIKLPSGNWVDPDAVDAVLYQNPDKDKPDKCTVMLAIPSLTHSFGGSIVASVSDLSEIPEGVDRNRAIYIEMDVIGLKIADARSPTWTEGARTVWRYLFQLFDADVRELLAELKANKKKNDSVPEKT